MLVAAISLALGFLLAAAMPMLGDLTGFWHLDFAIYAGALFGIGYAAGLFRSGPIWLPAVLLAVGQFVAWNLYVPADPLWIAGAIFGIGLTVGLTLWGAVLGRRSAPNHRLQLTGCARE